MNCLTDLQEWRVSDGFGPAVGPGPHVGPVDASGGTVYGRIRSWIVGTPLPIGSRIRAADVAVVLRVSNTPVREALIRLSAEGLVDNRPGSGFFIPIPRVDEAAALFDACHLIVAWSLRRLIETRLKPRVNGYAAVEPAPRDQRRPADVAYLCAAFNQAVAAAIDNPILCGMLHNVDDRLFQLRVIDAQAPEMAERQVTVIEDASDAVRSGRPEAAIALLAEHHAGLAARVTYLVERRILSGLEGAGEPVSPPA